MKKNVGDVDKLLRALLGSIIIFLGLYYKNWWGAIGLIPLLTGVFGICGPYYWFGISTIGKAKTKPKKKKKK